MAAAFDVFVDTGGTDNTPGAETDVDALGPPNIRMKTNDNTTIDAVDPIPIPTSGTKNSYWKSAYLKCSTAPDTKVDNLRFWPDVGNFGTGITMNVGSETPVKNSGSDAGYGVAVGTPGDTGTIMTSHPDITATADAYSFTEGSPKVLTISETSAQIDATGETSNYLVFQMVVGTTAAPGDLANKNFNIKYDEI